MIDRDANVGKLLLALDFVGTGISPAIEAALPPDANVEQVVEQITKGIHATLTKHLGKYVTPLGGKIGVSVNPRTGIIKTAKERHAEGEQRLSELRGAFRQTPEEEAEQERQINEHPMNGKLGWWRVDGIRHSCMVRASSCREALEKSTGHVGDWERPKAEWVGEELPDVIDCG